MLVQHSGYLLFAIFIWEISKMFFKKYIKIHLFLYVNPKNISQLPEYSFQGSRKFFIVRLSQSDIDVRYWSNIRQKN